MNIVQRSAEIAALHSMTATAPTCLIKKPLDLKAEISLPQSHFPHKNKLVSPSVHVMITFSLPFRENQGNYKNRCLVAQDIQ